MVRTLQRRQHGQQTALRHYWLLHRRYAAHPAGCSVATVVGATNMAAIRVRHSDGAVGRETRTRKKRNAGPVITLGLTNLWSCL